MLYKNVMSATHLHLHNLSQISMKYNAILTSCQNINVKGRPLCKRSRRIINLPQNFTHLSEEKENE